MTFEHRLRGKWRIRESHYCAQHDRIEKSEAWVTSGAVSVLVAIIK